MNSERGPRSRGDSPLIKKNFNFNFILQGASTRLIKTLGKSNYYADVVQPVLLYAGLREVVELRLRGSTMYLYSLDLDPVFIALEFGINCYNND